MKIKILLMPFIIIIAAVLAIWLVYPAYSNGFDGVKENYAKLKGEQKRLAELRDKSENIKKLSAQVAVLPEKEVLYSFIPETAKEEEIINDLTNLSSASGLLFLETIISQPAKKSVQEEISNDDKNGSEKETGITLPEVQNLKTEIRLAGSYEKIKEFLSNLGKLERSSDIEAVEISKNASDTSGSNILSAKVVANFNILKKTKIKKDDMADPIFSSAELKTEIIGKIKNRINANNFQLNVEQKGKSNLFQL